MRTSAWLAAASLLAAAPILAAQTIAGRVDGVRNGTVHMRFAPRPGVCGDGNGSVWIRNLGDSYRPGDRGFTCIVSPVHVRLGRADGQTVSIRKCIGCRGQAAGSADVDLGEVPPVEAARYLISLAHGTAARNSDEAVSAAAFADAGDLTREFAALARDENAGLESRKQALFWMSQGESSTAEMVRLYDDLRPTPLREHYAFALSQRRDDASVSKLIDMARRDPDSHVRKQAMFWLGQTKDPRAIAFFRDILR